MPGISVTGSTPTFRPKWRVGRRGLIQRIDRDETWVFVPSGVQSDLFDITFANASLGWAVGQAGTVLRTTDGGVTWTKISVPTVEDIVRVSATSELVARMMTRRGKILATADGGKSWAVSPAE